MIYFFGTSNLHDPLCSDGEMKILFYSLLLNHVPFVFRVGSDYRRVYIYHLFVFLTVQRVFFRASNERRTKGDLGNCCCGHEDIRPKVTGCNRASAIYYSTVFCLFQMKSILFIRTSKNDGATNKR